MIVKNKKQRRRVNAAIRWKHRCTRTDLIAKDYEYAERELERILVKLTSTECAIVDRGLDV